ncbi:MAG: ImmA/IrrE family metallo-endopeptidase [bacterium]|nr:ImmA/IrrE family metallo-endopeptidase [bacterium]
MASEERAELGLGPLDALDPWMLASHHGVDVFALSDLDSTNASTASAIQYFMGAARSRFSAMLLPVGLGVTIVENDAHAVTRRAAKLAHELGHFLLEHGYGYALLIDGCRDVDPILEEEALWLSGELLIPRAGALECARTGAPDRAVAEHFGVSIAFARMRMNRSGVRKQVGREQQARRRR